MKLRLKKRKIGEIYRIPFTPFVFENISGDCLNYISKNISQTRAISTEVFATILDRLQLIHSLTLIEVQIPIFTRTYSIPFLEK